MKSVLRSVMEMSISLNSISQTSEAVVDKLLDINGVEGVEYYAGYVLTVRPNGNTNSEIMHDIQRVIGEAELILKEHEEWCSESSKISEAIDKALDLPASIDMSPSVFRAKRLDGSIHIGINHQPKGTKVGTKFHYDHGAGINKNTDAQVVWVM